MIIDFHIHLSRPEHEHPWVLAWMRENFQKSGDGSRGETLEDYMTRILTPRGMRAYLQKNGIDLAVGLAEVTPITTGPSISMRSQLART